MYCMYSLEPPHEGTSNIYRVSARCLFLISAQNMNLCARSVYASSLQS